ncbi:hypothetical protein [Bartonella schoenbuchensis]|uniref:Uncharacterized protein n=1 Tax=Bartonella schoenbuchensis (strain DSM 13525 / NCTC 13165 / R1) TaxID=687861 RepID=E6Z0W2_BARSR|nr:hypothetical protein [Bartonella schoenbuchensis]AQX31144.1 hypothetical protein BscR1v2_012300 [Bartonella schoenbuchensis R1]CBI82750.1 conserved hypothetical protein [Bartonella schoenbuchensis R1]
MNKQVSVTDHEILLAVCDDGHHLSSSGPIDETEIMNIINGVGDVVSILRIDLHSNRYDDISEEVAELYVQKYLNDNDHYYFVEDAPYPFIADSWAYSDVLDKIRERENTSPFYSNCQQ